MPPKWRLNRHALEWRAARNFQLIELSKIGGPSSTRTYIKRSGRDGIAAPDKSPLV